MKKIIPGTAISLALFVEINFDKAKKEALKKFSNEQIQKWIDEDKRIQEIEKSYIEYNNKKGKSLKNK